MKKLIVTGCNGQLGRAINRELADNPEYELVNTDVSDLDITDIDAVIKLAEEVKPYAIINCAAHTAVDACEVQQDLAYKINALGPRNLAIAATKVGAKLVHVSTDYVFEGNATEPITEFDMPHPVSMYGKTKLAGEKFVEQFADRYFIIRTAWLYGEGKNFLKTMLRLAENHSEVSVVCDQVGSPTTATELARAICALLPTENYGTFHGTCEGVCSWADFAAAIFKKTGRNCKVNYITSVQYKENNPASADRPAYSVLENYMLKLTGSYTFAYWEDALDEYLRDFVE